MKNKITTILLLFSAILFAQNERVFTGKCGISQTGGGAGFWQVSVVNFNDPGGQFTAEDITTSDFLFFSDSGTPFSLDITEVVSASGSGAVIKVSNVGVTGISSVPTTNSSFVSRTTVGYGLFPWVANIPANENQLQQEYLVYLVDSLLSELSGGGSATDLTFAGASSPFTLNSSTGTDVTFGAIGNITLARSSNQLNIGTTGVVTSVTASSPLASSGGVTPDISLTGIVPVANGGTGLSTQGWVDLTNQQLNIGGTKGFTAGLQFGATALPTGVLFGASEQTGFGLKAGSTADIAESSFQDFGGLLVLNYLNGGNARQTTRFIATGTDAGANGSEFRFDVRAIQAGANVTQGLKVTTSSLHTPVVHVGVTIGTWPTANLQVSAGGGIGFESTNVAYRFTADGSGAEDFKLLQNTGGGITTSHIDASFLGWVDGSDSVLKKNIVPIKFTREQITSLQAYQFDWKHSDSADVSVIAQDLLQDPVLALAVRGVEGVDTLGVSARALASLALGMVGELQLQIDSLTQGNADTVAAANNLAIDRNKEAFVITGTTQINTISSSGRRTGSEIILMFTSSVTVNDNSGTLTGSNRDIKLEGAADFSATADDTLRLMFDGTNWRQTGRSVN